MISLKVLSTAATIALVVPLMAPDESLAQNSGLAARQGGGAARQGGGGFAVRQGGGSGLVARQGGGGGVPGQRYSGGGGYRGGYHRDRDRGFIPGVVAGAVIGGAIASQGYYGGPGYDDGQYYDDSAAVAVAPQGGDDAVANCMQTYRSYDPQSGTYVGFDGQQHPCP
jgi:BA14K-like protein